MMAAAQPFISGAISKTVNMPQESTVAEIKNTYVEAWRMGLKCVAIYRDGSKRSQPLNTSKGGKGKESKEAKAEGESADLQSRIATLESEVKRLEGESGQPLRRRLPDTRSSVTHKFDIAGHEGYLTVGLFEDGQPGEMFITMAKEGSTIGGLMDAIGTLTSMALQYGVPLDALVKKFAHQRFEPSGFTKNPEIRSASSIIDYVFRWLAIQFIDGYREASGLSRNQPELAIPGLMEEVKKKLNRPVPELALADEETTILLKNRVEGVKSGNGGGLAAGRADVLKAPGSLTEAVAHFMQDAPTCPNCGHVAVRNGACFKCLNCGESLGCS
jgi:ribonucleoside-diphosphate reductase alpha chain